jgi:hypothetical protein
MNDVDMAGLGVSLAIRRHTYNLAAESPRLYDMNPTTVVYILKLTVGIPRNITMSPKSAMKEKAQADTRMTRCPHSSSCSLAAGGSTQQPAALTAERTGDTQERTVQKGLKFNFF